MFIQICLNMFSFFVNITYLKNIDTKNKLCIFINDNRNNNKQQQEHEQQPFTMRHEKLKKKTINLYEDF